MIKLFIKLKGIAVRALEIFVMVMMAVLVLDVVWQIFTRFIMKNPSSWTEELATMILIWVSLLGASVTTIRKGHLGVDFFVNKLNVKSRTVVEIIVYIFIGFFATAAMILGGGQLVRLTLLYGQLSPALGIKMGYVYLALPISGIFMLGFSIEMIIEKAGSLIAGKKTTD